MTDISCHTERSEVSINLRCILKFLWIFRSQSSLKMTKSAVIVLKTLFARHCERAKRAWQSTKKQCYHLEFKQTPKFVILSAAKYPRMEFSFV